jgi:hypothetical protein
VARLAHWLCLQRARVGGGRAAVGEVQGACQYKDIQVWSVTAGRPEDPPDKKIA